MRLVELNCENLFDTIHDAGFDDHEFLPSSQKRWTKQRYRHKINLISKELIACSPTSPPDIVVLIEVENDSVMRDLTKRSPLATLHYKYLMTHSNDPRGIDVALMYLEPSFKPLETHSVDWKKKIGIKTNTRNLLHVKGQTMCGDTVDILVCHQPSRRGGRKSELLRNKTATGIRKYADSLMALNKNTKIIIIGDFNDTPHNKSIKQSLGAMPVATKHPDNQVSYCDTLLYNLATTPLSTQGFKGTYRYRGNWEMLDQCIINGKLLNTSKGLRTKPGSLRIIDEPFLLSPDKHHGGLSPRRTYLGSFYLGGFSDHLPIVIEFEYCHATDT
ncbi:MAG: endonuclease [Prevotellaceae bacterium]|nr:endonuclease [Prevotellaceae bacterium]